MRKLSEFDSERQAQRLVDQLLVAEIDSQIRGEDPWEVWVLDDRSMADAKRELDGFEDGAAPSIARKAEQIRRARERQSSADPSVDVARRWREASNSGERGIGPITVFLIAASGLAAFFGSWDTPLVDPTYQLLSIEPWTSSVFLGQVRAGEVWRLVTPMLIHFGLLHLLFNMMWLWQLGNEVEHRHGSLAMIGLVLLAQVPSGLGQYLATGASFGGMSGVVYGVFGFVWMQARYGRRHYQLGEPVAVIMMIWFVLCLTGFVGRVANVGHAGGLIAGLLAGAPAYIRHLRNRRASVDFRDGSWASETLSGRQRFMRRYFTPFVPLWFLAVAAIAIVIDFWP